MIFNKRAGSGMEHYKAKPIGSKRIIRRGKFPYVEIKISPSKHWPKEHRYIMEQHLGRKLNSKEVVHHKDGNPLNNNIDNLEVMAWGDHMRLHLLSRGQDFYKKISHKLGAKGPRPNARINQWSKKFLACTKCGGVNRKHYGRGLCHYCYNLWRRRGKPSIFS